SSSLLKFTRCERQAQLGQSQHLLSTGTNLLMAIRLSPVLSQVKLLPGHSQLSIDGLFSFFLLGRHLAEHSLRCQQPLSLLLACDACSQPRTPEPPTARTYSWPPPVWPKPSEDVPPLRLRASSNVAVLTLRSGSIDIAALPRTSTLNVSSLGVTKKSC